MIEYIKYLYSLYARIYKLKKSGWRVYIEVTDIDRNGHYHGPTEIPTYKQYMTNKKFKEEVIAYAKKLVKKRAQSNSDKYKSQFK